MKQEAFVYVAGVVLAAAAGIAIGGSPFGDGGAAETTQATATIAPPNTAVPDVTTSAVTTTDPALPSSTTTTSTVSVASSTSTTTTIRASVDTATTTAVASAGPIPTTTTSTTTTTTTTTTAPDEPDDSDGSDGDLRNRDSLRVAAANASGVGGVAAAKVVELELAGYVDVVAADALETSATSAIYFAVGLDREVFLAAADLDWGGVVLLPMAEAPEIEPAGEFDLLVVVGSDRAAPAPQP